MNHHSFDRIVDLVEKIAANLKKEINLVLTTKRNSALKNKNEIVQILKDMEQKDMILK